MKIINPMLKAKNPIQNVRKINLSISREAGETTPVL
jgi:hypothetical protein